MVSDLRGLYVITDQRLTPDPQLLDNVEQALRGGASLVQYRNKHSDEQTRFRQARELNHLCREHHALFIINDDVTLAARCQAQGVHLGQDDASLASARDYLGPGYLLGGSCYNRMGLAHTAIQAGADYIAFGRFFASSTKPEAVQAAPELLHQARELDIPVCAIGGITADNAGDLISAGADMIAVIEGVFGAPDIATAARRLSSLFHTP